MTTTTIYDPVARSFHGVMLVMILGLLAVGLYMTDLEPSPDKWQLYGLHKAIGMIALALIVARILWRATHQPPPALATHAQWERRLAGLVHGLLYFGMVAMPVSGYVMSSAGGHGISLFGLVDIPLLIQKNQAVGMVARTVHEFAGYALMAAIALHVAGAVKHAIIDRDPTLGRMFRWLRR
jgi:cytochrome b561